MDKIKEPALRELGLLAQQQRSKARNAKIRTITDQNFVCDGSTVDKMNLSPIKGGHIAQSDYENFGGLLLDNIDKLAGADVEAERLYMAFTICRILNLDREDEANYGANFTQIVTNYLKNFLRIDTANRRNKRKAASGPNEQNPDMASILEPLVNCAQFWFVLADMLQSSSEMFAHLAASIVSALFVHTNISHCIEAWDILMEPYAKLARIPPLPFKDLQQTTGDAPEKLKSLENDIIAQFRADLFGAITYGLSNLAALDDQSSLMSIVSSHPDLIRELIHFATLAPTQFTNLQTVAHMHAAEALAILLHAPANPANLDESEKPDLFSQRMESVIALEPKLPERIIAFIDWAMREEEFWDLAFDAFDEVEKNDIHALFGCILSISRSAKHKQALTVANAGLAALRDAFAPIATDLCNDVISISLPRGKYLKHSVGEYESRVLTVDSHEKIHLAWLVPSCLASLVLTFAAVSDESLTIDPSWKQYSIKDARTDGNNEFEENNFLLANMHYAQALELIGADTNNDFKNDRCVLYSNRSQAYLKLQDGFHALENATAALEINPEHGKSSARKGLALDLIKKRKKPLAEIKTDDDGTFSLVPMQKWTGPCWTGLAAFLDKASLPAEASRRRVVQTSKSRDRKKKNEDATTTSTSSPVSSSWSGLVCPACLERDCVVALQPCTHRFCGKCSETIKECVLCQGSIQEKKNL